LNCELLYKPRLKEGRVFHLRTTAAFQLSSPRCGGSYLDGAVVIAMALMRMVEMASHEVVRMIAVRNSFMPAARAVTVSGFVTAARVSSGAFRGIVGIHFQLVLVHMIAMHIVHVAIVKETLMPIVHESRVAALISVLMRVSLMSFMTHIFILVLLL
jgi:hypothetical protein